MNTGCRQHIHPTQQYAGKVGKCIEYSSVHGTYSEETQLLVVLLHTSCMKPAFMPLYSKDTSFCYLCVWPSLSQQIKTGVVFLVRGDYLPSPATGAEFQKRLCSHSPLLLRVIGCDVFQGKVLSQEAVACFPDGLCTTPPYCQDSLKQHCQQPTGSC